MHSRLLLTLALLLSLGIAPQCLSQNIVGQVYMLSGDLLNEKCEVMPECDCCSTDLAFLTTDTFAMIERCVNGDAYFTGRFSVTKSQVTLIYEQFVVIEVLDGDYNWKENKKKALKIDQDQLDISICGGKSVLSSSRPYLRNGHRLNKPDEDAVIKGLANSKAFQMLKE